MLPSLIISPSSTPPPSQRHQAIKMPTPYLPPEIWQRIATYLPPASLSSLSKVCRTFTEISREEQHFRRHLRISQTDTNPALLFRRLQAWISPKPQIGYTNQPSSPLTTLCIVEDTLLLIDTSNFRLIAFPSGKTVRLDRLIPDIALDGDGMVFTHSELVRFKSSYAVVPDASIAFINWHSPTTLTILNVSKWEIVKHRIPERKIIHVIHGGYIVLAGNRGECIMYYTDHDILVLVDWRTGNLVKEVKNVPEGVRWMYGECPTINRNTIVGLVAQHATCKKVPLSPVDVSGFDGVETSFAVANCQTLNTVLRSADTKTHVLVAYESGMPYNGLHEFVAYRSHEHSMQSWSGYLKMRSSMGLQNNGQIIASTHNQKFQRSGRRETVAQRMVYEELKDDGTTETLYIPELNNPGQAIWHRCTFDGGFAVIGSCSGLIQLVKLVNSGETKKEYLVKSWQVDGLNNMCVLADHVIVVELVDGSLKWFHFDRFCRGVEGVYACPLTDSLARFHFTAETTDGEADLPAHKRTRRF